MAWRHIGSKLSAKSSTDWAVSEKIKNPTNTAHAVPLAKTTRTYSALNVFWILLYVVSVLSILISAFHSVNYKMCLIRYLAIQGGKSKTMHCTKQSQQLLQSCCRWAVGWRPVCCTPWQWERPTAYSSRSHGKVIPFYFVHVKPHLEYCIQFSQNWEKCW